MTDLKEIAKKLGFKAMVDNWDEYGKEPLVKKILEAEELDKNRRSLEKRLKASHIQELKPVSDFDWNWPKVIDRELVEELFTLKFLGRVNQRSFCWSKRCREIDALQESHLRCAAGWKKN